MVTTPLIPPPGARTPRPPSAPFWYTYGQPIRRFLGITLSATVVLHLAHEKLYFTEVQRRMEQRLQGLEKELEEKAHLHSRA